MTPAAPAGTPPPGSPRPAPVSLIARVGDDQAGRAATAELDRAGRRLPVRHRPDPGHLLRGGAGLAGRRADHAARPRSERRAVPGGRRAPDRPEPRQHLHLSGYVLLDRVPGRPACARSHWPRRARVDDQRRSADHRPHPRDRRRDVPVLAGRRRRAAAQRLRAGRAGRLGEGAGHGGTVVVTHGVRGASHSARRTDTVSGAGGPPRRFDRGRRRVQRRLVGRLAGRRPPPATACAPVSRRAPQRPDGWVPARSERCRPPSRRVSRRGGRSDSGPSSSITW